jgi:hypothetical protein
MKAFNKLFGAHSAAIWAMVILMVTVAGVYLAPRGDASGEWIYVKEGPVVQVSPTPVPYKKATMITIAGVGFEPNTELGIRIEMGGVISDIRHQVKPTPKTDKDGAFMSQWTLGNEMRLIGSGVHVIRIVNEDGDVLAHAPFVLGQQEKKAEKKKAKK